MEFLHYLEPFNLKSILQEEGELISKVITLSEDDTIFPGDIDIAVVGLPFSDINLTYSAAPHNIREQLYKLADPLPAKFKILDIGDIKRGKNFHSTLIGIRDVLSYLLSQNICILVIGGTGILKSALLQAVSFTDRYFEYTAVEPFVSLYNELDYIPENIFDVLSYNIIGSQAYYMKPGYIKWLKRKNYQNYRIGDVRDNIPNVEPVIRDSLLATITLHAIKHSDASGQKLAFPNGFYGEEAAQIARFIGLSDTLQMCGVFDYCPENDHKQQTSQLAAQLLWFVIEGYSNRVIEHIPQDNNIQKFIVNHSDDTNKLIFYKSDKTGRWWMEIPVKATGDFKIISCSYEDYRQASEQNVPFRWIRAFQKFN
ncbi:MAG: hypothetical protein R6U04_08845 [Bacteroidales bacterium]